MEKKYCPKCGEELELHPAPVNKDITPPVGRVNSTICEFRCHEHGVMDFSTLTYDEVKNRY